MTGTVHNDLRDKQYFIFDLDGTLMDSRENHKQGLWEVVRYCKRNPNLYQTLYEIFDKAGKADRDKRYAIYEDLLWEHDPKDLDYIYWCGVGKIFKWIDGAVETLMALKDMGKNLSILTNGGLVQHRKLYHLENELCEDLVSFDFKVVTGDYGREKYKPHPHCLNKIIKNYHADRSECVYIGNTIRDDHGVAQNSGIDFVLVDYEEEHSEFEGNKIFHLKELICK